VRYVPATALVVRRSAAWRTRFDEQLRHGEDVDFIWRLVDAGGDVRYEPSVTVRHVEPTSVSALAARRFRYGASVGPLAMRHGTRLSGPSLVGLLAPVKVVQHARRGALGWPTALDLAARSLVASGAAYGKWAGSTWAPLSPLAVVGAGASWLARRPEVDPLTWTAASVVDDAAYAAGVWFGSARARVAAPLRPRLAASR
jgi:hypothetical protein